MTDAQVGGIAADRLRSYIERWERLEEEKKALACEQKDIMKEAKSAGFDVKVIKAIIAERKKEAAEVEEFEAVKDTYRRALGMSSAKSARLKDHPNVSAVVSRLSDEMLEEEVERARQAFSALPTADVAKKLIGVAVRQGAH